MHSSIHIPNEINGLVSYENLSYHQKTASGLEWKKELQLFKVVLCSFCVDTPHQKWDVDSIYMTPTSWRVVKDYVIPLAV